ncbi:transcription initiation factor IIF subunit alpha [Cryptomeria japonica]|uniref:transcription initiation factor IIF subunit alpha n=1 Tax=Cryptomeria japonica TaxID=3369 RepID=UPI0027D9F951|nr:transcription initiation factor IIF subunit alpha [Cryptomeria japonica]
MSGDLVLKSSCGGCGTTSDLYGSNCKHMTLCLACGKSMAETKASCSQCGVPVTRLIREYNVRASNSSDKSYSIARFVQGLPTFSRKKGSEAKWFLNKEGLKSRQLTDALRDKYKNKPWILEDETGQYQFQGQLEGAQHATYYLLMMHGKEFLAIPAGAWYNFNKVAQYKQLTLEEAEEKMKNRRRTADGFQRWMMKAANTGAAAFGEVEKLEGGGGGGGGGGGSGGRRKKGDDDDDDTVLSDKAEEDEDEEEERKSRLGLNKRGGDDDEEGARGADLDGDDDDVEKGDDWEHEEIFTDDDEAVGNDPEERDELAPEVPAPPEIKQDEDDEEGEGNEEEGEGLSKSGKELKKLLGRQSGLNESDGEEDDEDEDVDDEIGFSPVLAPKHKDIPKEEPVDTTPTKEKTSASARASPATTKPAKGKRKSGSDDAKPSGSVTTKKTKTEDSKSTTQATIKDENILATKNVSPSGKQVIPNSSKATVSQATGPVTEEEVRTALRQMAPVTTQELVAKFKARLKTPEDKSSFATILKKISRIQKTNGANFVVLRDK